MIERLSDRKTKRQKKEKDKKTKKRERQKDKKREKDKRATLTPTAML